MNILVRWSPAIAALIAVMVMALLSFTPMAWKLEGSPDSSYPEIVFMTIGLPSAVVALAAGVLAARRAGRRRPGLRRTFTIVCLLELLVCALLAATLFLPDAVLGALPDGFIAVLFFGWPVSLVATIVTWVLGVITDQAPRAAD